MAEAGRGEVEYVMLAEDGSKAAKRFYERVRSPLLTDLSIDWNGLPVAEWVLVTLDRAAVSEEPTQKRILSDLIEKAFKGSAAQLAMRALSIAPASKKELDEVRAYLDAIEKKAKKK